jgi:AAA15 family ATPase/GTPase
MIKNLTIKRFKSIQSLSLPCRKVNMFIGPPDTGKTNILEALHFLSRLGWNLPIGASLRLSQDLGFEPLFFHQFFDQPFEISVDEVIVRASIKGHQHLKIECPPPEGNFGLGFEKSHSIPKFEWIRFYSYTSSQDWGYETGSPQYDKIVTPSAGVNLMYIARHHAKVYDFLKEIVAALNWKLRFDKQQNRFRLSEVRRDEILDYNLELLSDSLKRLFFYGAILITSQGAALVLDEPDVYAFPPYPKTLGEMIAGDSSNQFFLTTHNPYFLTGIIEKTPAEDLALFVCYRDSEGGTKSKLLTYEEIEQVIEQGASVFFNLDVFIGA